MLNRNISFAAIACMAAAADKGAATPKADATPQAGNTPAAAQSDAAATAPKPAPVIGEISAAPLPQVTRARGGKAASIWPFDKLEAPQKDEAGNIVAAFSFPVTGKTKREMSTIVSNANRKNRVPKTDANGATVYKTKELKDAAGNVTNVPTNEPELVAAKHFVVYEVKPEDNGGATLRVFRDL
jgi:hypothetical protein